MAKKDAPVSVCSFCLKPETVAGALVAGPGVHICEGCVALCVEVLALTPPLVKRIAPWEHAMSDDELLAMLPHVATAGVQVERNLAEWVRKGRSQGITWARLGEALGMTRQSAWERFSVEE